MQISKQEVQEIVSLHNQSTDSTGGSIVYESGPLRGLKTVSFNT